MSTLPPRLTCALCRTALEAKDVYRPLDVARCSSCDAVIDIRRPSGVPVRGARRERVRPPAELRIEDTAKRFVVRSGVSGRRAAVLLVLAGAMFAFALWGFLGAASARTGVLFVVYGVSLGMVFLEGARHAIVGRRRIRVEGRTLAARQFAFFSRHEKKRARDLDVGRLKQLYVTERAWSRGDARVSQYDLRAILKEGTTVTVLSGIGDPDEALWLEQELERRLDLADAPVEGEVARRMPS